MTRTCPQAEAGGSGIISKRVTGQTGADQFVMKIPNNKVYFSLSNFQVVHVCTIAMVFYVLLVLRLD